MTRPLPDYDYYSCEYFGRLDEDTFRSSLSDAAAAVDYLIGYNEVTEGNLAAYKDAVCAALDKAVEVGDGGGFSIGSFSVGGSSSDSRDAAVSAALPHLATSGLLWSGIA